MRPLRPDLPVFVVATSKLLEERSDMTMGVRANAPPRMRPWGMYGFGVHDPNGVPVNV